MRQYPTTTNISDDMIEPIETTSIVLDCIPWIGQNSAESCAASCLSAIHSFANKSQQENFESAQIWQDIHHLNKKYQTGRPGTHPHSILDWAAGHQYSAQLFEERLNNGRSLTWIRNSLKSGIPPLVCWADWGGHWCVVTGYISGGTGLPRDDYVLIMDPAVPKMERTFVNAGKFYMMWYDGQHFERVYYHPLIVLSKSEIAKDLFL